VDIAAEPAAKAAANPSRIDRELAEVQALKAERVSYLEMVGQEHIITPMPRLVGDQDRSKSKDSIVF